jgi:ubiquinone/menaquinone biosynthesis C-methylase UbiE
MMAWPRKLEPEVMDTAEEACDYDQMDHTQVNQQFISDLLTFLPIIPALAVDLGTGTAQIPVALCQRVPELRVDAVDASLEMLRLAQRNVRRAGCASRIRLILADAKELPYPEQSVPLVISNSLIHHLPEPRVLIGELLRIIAPGGWLFVRDLARPAGPVERDRLVDRYAAEANPHQRQLFSESLEAALTLDEIRERVVASGLPAESVQMTSDRHWTWSARIPLA